MIGVRFVNSWVALVSSQAAEGGRNAKHCAHALRHERRQTRCKKRHTPARSQIRLRSLAKEAPKTAHVLAERNNVP